jgi:hypothetical protein
LLIEGVDADMRSVRAHGVPHMVVDLAALLCALVGVFTFGAASARAYSLPGVACPSVSQCTAVDSVGHEVTFNPTVPGTPTPTPIDGSERLQDLACPSVSQCTAVDGAGREMTFNPTAPGTPSPTPIDGSGHLVAVACPSVSQCTAVDSTERADRELTFDPNAPGTLTPHMVGGAYPFCGMNCHTNGYVTGVACPSVKQCTAVDDAGREVTFDPNAPGDPTPTSVTINPLIFGGLEGVACPSVKQCTAVERAGRQVTFDPTSPGNSTPVSIEERQLYAVACPSSLQCTAVDEYGGEVTFDPNAPGSATRAQIDGSGPEPTTTITTTTTGTPSHGVAEAAGSARVKRGIASIRVTCTGAGACKGTIKLLIRFQRKHVVYQQSKRRLFMRAHTIVIGTAAFSIATGASVVVHVHLLRQGVALVLRAGTQGLKVKVGGSEIKTRSLLLKRSQPRAKHGRRTKRR